MWATAEIDLRDVCHSYWHAANLRGIGRKKRPAQLAATKNLFDAIVPDFSTRLQPIKNILHARVQSRLPLAKQTARVVDQQQVTAQRLGFQHPFTRR